MKNFILCSFALLSFFSNHAEAQCIKDIQNLVQMPAPCFFIGMIDYDNPECFEESLSANYKYKWWITSASNGKFIALYEGMAFQHTFEKFGGYKFCLEIDKDDDPYNTPDVVECVTYTTCQICTEDKIGIEYVSCPYGSGCNINTIANIHAENAIGLKPTAKIIYTYLPTPQELAGGISSYELEYDEIAVDFNGNTDSIHINQNLPVPFKRGCFIPKIIFKLLDGYGAHGMDGVACTELVLQSDQKFRCIACSNDDGDCRASEVATAISNEDGTCELFTTCHLLRENENESEEAHGTQGFAFSPNPASDNLHIELPNYDCDNRQVMLINNIGQPVVQMKMPSDEQHTDLDISRFANGLYLVTILEYGMVAHSAQVVIAK